MLRFITNRMMGALIVLWAIITLSFLLLRFAPGSPFDQDRALPPAVEANKWIAFGLGEAIEAPEAGTITALGDVTVSRDYDAGTLVATLTGKSGTVHQLEMPTGGTLVNLNVEPGELLEAGARVAVVPKALWSQYLTTLGRYATGDFGVTISSDAATSRRPFSRARENGPRLLGPLPKKDPPCTRTACCSSRSCSG